MQTMKLIKCFLKFLEWFLILLGVSVFTFLAIGVVSTLYRFATAKEVTEAEAERNAWKELHKFCKSESCNPYKFFISARRHGISPTNPQIGSAWDFEFSDSTDASRTVVGVCVDKYGNTDFCGAHILNTSISDDRSYDTGIRE